MSAKNKDQIISNFIGITQCSRQEAAEYLEAAQWNEEAAVAFFFDSGPSQTHEPIPSPKASRSSVIKPAQNIPGKPSASESFAYESDDDFLQNALEESLHVKQPEKPPSIIPKRTNEFKSIVSSKINTFDNLRKNEGSSDDEDGQAFYAGGSERSGQQIIGPPKAKDNDKNVTKIFEAARKQGAKEADDDESASSSHTRKEKPFAGVGYSLNDNNPPSRTQGQPPSGASAAAANQVEILPIRFYSNGFTVGDGELRKFEENKEFMDYIKSSKVPPELRSLNNGEQQIEVRFEDHRGEEYKRVAPGFKPFGGAGRTVGLPESSQAPFRSSIASPVDTGSGTTDTNRLEQLAEKRLKTSSSSTTLRLRLPDISTPVRIQIDLNRSLADVRRFLNENVASLQSNTFEFMEPPSTKIKREDEKRKISEAKLSNSTLAVRRVT